MSKLRIALFFTLVLALAATPILSGCTDDGKLEATVENPLVLRYVHFLPPGSSMDEARVALGEAIEEKTGGRVIVEVYGAGTLCESSECAEAVRTGVAEFGEMNPSYTPGVFPMAGITEVPGFFDGALITHMVANELIEEYIGPEARDVGIEVLACCVLSGCGHIHSTTLMQSLADFEGVTISCPSEVSAGHLANLGFVPSLIPGAETYLALEKGGVEAALADFSSANMNHYYEITEYATLLALWGQGICYIGMNPEIYDALPSDIRDIIVEECRKFENEQVEAQVAKEEAGRQVLIDEGIEIITLSDEDYEAALGLLSGAEEWIADQEAAGVDNAREYAEAFLALLDEYSQ